MGIVAVGVKDYQLPSINISVKITFPKNTVDKAFIDPRPPVLQEAWRIMYWCTRAIASSAPSSIHGPVVGECITQKAGDEIGGPMNTPPGSITKHTIERRNMESVSTFRK